MKSANTDLTKKWVNKTLNADDIQRWVRRQEEAKRLTGDEFDHVVFCLHKIYKHAAENAVIEKFLSAVLKNDFIEAGLFADETNRKVLSLYAKFVHNVPPMHFVQKQREERGG